jgi:hypothetical protein
MAFAQVTDHVAQALAALAEQYKGKPRVEALLTAFVNQVQKAEDGLWTLWSGRQFGASAGAAFLDVCGRIVGEPRSGRSDASYLIALRARILLNVSSGTIEELYAIFALLCAGTGLSFQIAEFYPKAFVMRLGGAATTAQNAADYFAMLVRAKDAGAHACLEYSLSTPANTFTLDSGPGLDVGHLADSLPLS